MRCWAGVDVGLHTSVLVVVDVDGTPVVRTNFPMDGAGHLEALRTLRACAGHRRERLQVAIEDSTSPLTASLVAAGFTVMAVHGVTLARFRLGQSVARSKSDRGDALTLANIIRLQPGVHHPVPRDTPEVLALRARTRAYEGRRRQLHKLESRLWSYLNSYYAAALPCLHARTSRDMYAALKLAPTPGAARRLRPRRLSTALEEAGRHRLNEQAATEIITELRVPHPRQPLQLELAAGSCLLEQLTIIGVLEQSANRLHEEAMAAARSHSLWPIVESFPALGQITGARLLAELGDDPERFASTRGLLSLAGLAPVTRQSGTVSTVHRRRIYNRPLGRAFAAWALPLRSTSPAAKTWYDHRRAVGDRHNAAIRNMLGGYGRALHHCLLTGAEYDEERMLRG